MNTIDIVAAVEMLLSGDHAPSGLQSDLEQFRAIAEQFKQQLGAMRSTMHQSVELAVAPLGNDEAKERFEELVLLYSSAFSLDGLIQDVCDVINLEHGGQYTQPIRDGLEAYHRVFGFPLPPELSKQQDNDPSSFSQIPF